MDAGIPESCLPASLEESSDEQIVFELESVTTSVELLKTEEGMEEEGSGEQGRGSRRCRSPSVLLERFLTGREREVEDTAQCQTELRNNNRLMDHTPLGLGVEGDLQSGADGMTLMGALRGQVIKVEEYSSDLIPCQNTPRATATGERGAVVGQLDPCGQQPSEVRVFLVKEEDPLILDEPQAFPGHGHTQLAVEEMGPVSNSHADREATSLEDREGRGDGDREEAASVSPLVLEAGVSGERCIVLRVKEEEREMALEPPQREHGLSVLLVSRAPGLDQQEDASQTEEVSLVSDLHPGPFADGGGFWVPMSSGCETEVGVTTIQECEEHVEESVQIGRQQNEHVRTAEGELDTEQRNTRELLEFLQQASDAEYSDSSDSEPEGEAIAMACCYESRNRCIIAPDEMSGQKQDHAKSNISAQRRPADSMTEEHGGGEVQQKQTPIEYFCQYLDWETWDEIARCNSTLSDTLHSVTAKEVAQFVGIHIAMGTLKFPDTKLYWQDLTKVPLIADAMPSSRFTLLARKLRLAHQAGSTETPRDMGHRAVTQDPGDGCGDRAIDNTEGPRSQLNTRNSHTGPSGSAVTADRSDIASSVSKIDSLAHHNVPMHRFKDVNEQQPRDSHRSSHSHSHYSGRWVQSLSDTQTLGDTSEARSFSSAYSNAQRHEDLHNSKNCSPVNTDLLWKVRTLIDRVRAGCLGLNREGNCGVDQYPLPLGHCRRSKSLKNTCPALQCTVLVGAGGVVLDFNLNGDESNSENTLQRIIPRNEENCERMVFICKEELCTPSILERLLVAGVRSAGKVGGVRGAFGDEFLSSDGRLTLLRCHQGFILSTLRKRQARPFSLIRAVERVQKEVQLNRNLQNLYHTPLTSSFPAKWPYSVLWHLTDLALVNSWLQFKQDNSNSRESLSLMAFRLEVAKALILSNDSVMPQSAPPHPPAPKLPSRDEAAPPAPVSAAPLPDATIRYDGLGHWPEQLAEGEGARCRFGGCERTSRVRCLKCCVFLCISRNHNCFLKFHSQGGI
ncbi:uncharacterized protein LOC118783972 [Megalops cyprinoides]|uniref:uncharacterized protein LOC118783972 n=1 Tax=Megalops cyprinoides TaxID=118141 RepID=UPI001864A70A|nr:uncharacterized protein LOC118783972 [Megalops cyprinoides]